MIRLFAAVAIPEDIAQGLTRRQQGLPGARWRPPQSLHFTLRFFGGLSENLADDLDAELGAIRSAAFDLALAGVGVFTNGAEPHAVWAGTDKSVAIVRLAARCETAARRAGLSRDARAFRSHATLAYLTKAEPARVAAWVQEHNLLKSPRFHVSSFGLYSSWRGDTGQVYRLERVYSLA